LHLANLGLVLTGIHVIADWQLHDLITGRTLLSMYNYKAKFTGSGHRSYVT